MIRKLFIAALLVMISFVATSSHSDPSWCQVTSPCDIVCEAPGATGETACECPCWTDRRVDETTCVQWYEPWGCWYLG